MKIELKTVDLPNGETYGYREREGGEVPVLLVHGNMTSSKHWDVLMEAMAPEYRIYAVDMRGFGASTYNQRITGLKDFSEDMKLFVDALELPPFHLAGWSTGGGVAMQFAADYPEQVKSLILLASASTRGYPFYTLDEQGQLTKRLTTIEEVEADPVKTLPVTIAYANRDKAFLRQLWNMLIYTKRQPGEARYEEYLDDMLTQRNLPDIYQALNVFNISHHANGLTAGTGDVGKIVAQALVLYGEHDQVVVKSMTDELVADLGGRAEAVMLEGCGHSPLIDDLAQLVVKMEQFLQKQEKKGETVQ